MLLVLCVPFLSSCKESEIPNGMKYANSTDVVEYSLFVPESWMINTANSKITLAQASLSDKTSISVQKLSYDSLDAWWNAMYNSINTNFSNVTEITKGEDTVIASLNAKKYVYTCVYGENFYNMLEIYGFVKNGMVYSIVITYPCKSNNGTNYTNEYHEDDIKSVLENFKFNENPPSGATEPSYECDSVPQGMKLASDNSIVDYLLFVPSSWTVENPVSVPDTYSTMSSAYIYNLEKNINVNIMQLNKPSTDQGYEHWWAEYKNQILNAFSYSDIENKEYSDIRFADTDCVCAEYSAKMGDSVFSFRIYAFDYRSSIHVMTFTILGEDSFDNYESDIAQILDNIRFN